MSSLEMYDESVLSKIDRQILFFNVIPGKLANSITPQMSYFIHLSFQEHLLLFCEKFVEQDCPLKI